MIKIILGVGAVIIIIAALVNLIMNYEPSLKNYHHDAYQLLELTHHQTVVGEQKISDAYDIILMDDFVSKEEFDMFYEEVLVVFPHIKKYGLNLKE